jgi:hypothetical protein
MEYEIGDDPQGLPDPPEAVRDGGVREDLVVHRWRYRAGRPSQADEDCHPDMLAQQLGEFA